MSNEKKKAYVNAVRPSEKGYTVFISQGESNHSIRNCHGNIVEKMFGSDLDYLLEAPTNGRELFRPLSEGELKDLMTLKG